MTKVEAFEAEATALQDRDVLVEDRFNRMQRLYLKSVLSDELIEEHRRQPLGQHSEPLARLLMYLQRSAANRYALKRDTRDGKYRIIRLSRIRGVAPELADDAVFDTVEEAYHGLFLKQVRELLES
jgi:branched-chain amino acid transport system permease protein